jgi:hypothetical protein
LLTAAQVRQKHNLAVRKFQCVVMNVGFVLIDLTKDSRLMFDHFSAPKQKASSQALNFLGKGQLGARSETDGQTFAF